MASLAELANRIRAIGARMHAAPFVFHGLERRSRLPCLDNFVLEEGWIS